MTDLFSGNIESRIYFRDLFRDARAKALSNSESFQDILFSLEKMGMFLFIKRAEQDAKYKKDLQKPSLFTLGSSYRCVIKELISPSNSIQFSELYDIVLDGRNDAMHQGAYARHLTDNCVQLALIIEDALMSSMERKVSNYMVRNVVQALPWQPISFIRQQMLSNSFSYIPLLVNSSSEMDSKTKWVLLSDAHLTRYLADSKINKYEKSNKDIKNERHERLVTIVEDAIKQNPFDTEDISAKTCKPDDTVDDVLEKIENGKPVIVIDGEDIERIVGIVTAFDLI
jgi:CBS domain-containing protein